MNRDELFFEIHRDLVRESPGLNRYTRQAFDLLPPLKEPRILDVGCGPGAATLLLAEVTDGEIIGLDTHQPFLDRLNAKIRERGWESRVNTLNCCMTALPFPGEHFDIVWAEGSIYVIGFERGLKEWKKFLKPGGYLVVHEMIWLHPDPPGEVIEYMNTLYPAIIDSAGNLDIIQRCGYQLVGHFALPQDGWWEGYYHPLEKRIAMLRETYKNDPPKLWVLDTEQEEIDIYRKYGHWYGSAFFVMQKK